MSLNSQFLLSCFLLLGCSVATRPKGLTLEVSTTNPKIDVNGLNPITPITSYWYPYLFLVKVNIGTFDGSSPSYKTYDFQIDTASDITWIQCEGCQSKGNASCSPQRDPYYPNTKSKSYKPLPCNKNPFCEKDLCNEGACSFNRTFGPGSYTSGILATETLTFPSTNGQLQPIEGLTVGCSVDSLNLKYPRINRTEPTPVSGALGLGWGPRSFLAQIDPVSKGKFSYCVKQSNTTTSYLRFGDDIVPPPNPQTTSISQVKAFSDYYVNVQGLSVNGVKLDFTEADFAVKSDGTGGVILDAGTLFGLLATPIYTKVHTALEQTLLKNQHVKREVVHNFTDLCYEELSPEARKSLPTLTVNLEGANLDIKPEALFQFADFQGKKLFCLAILENQYKNAIGSFNQLNQKFVYDTKAKTVSFGPVDCEKNS